TKGTGRRAATKDGRPQAGKTGTIDSNEAVWFAGYTPEAAGVAMIAIDKRKKPFIRGKKGFRSRGVKGFKLDSGERLEGSGSGDAGEEIWKPTMERYLKDQPKTKFKSPPKKLIGQPKKKDDGKKNADKKNDTKKKKKKKRSGRD